jgi:hypothetical protein
MVNESACMDVANVEIKMYTGCYNMIVSRMSEPFVAIILSPFSALLLQQVDFLPESLKSHGHLGMPGEN